MRVLVCGSRHFKDYPLLEETLDALAISTIIHGAARGADTLSGTYAERRGIPVAVYPANWAEYGKRAGHIRNRQMLVEGKPDLVIAFWDGKSKGTHNMISKTREEGLRLKVIDIAEDNTKEN